MTEEGPVQSTIHSRAYGGSLSIELEKELEMERWRDQYLHRFHRDDDVLRWYCPRFNGCISMGAFPRGLGGPYQFDVATAPMVEMGTSSSSMSSDSSSGSSGSSRMERYQVPHFYESARGMGAETGPQRSIPPWDW